jgi:uncharacterized protein YoxC
MSEVSTTVDSTSELKKPAMILASINTASMVVGFAYFYKEIEKVKEDIKKITEAQKALAVNMSNLNNQIQQKSDVIKTLSEDIKLTSESVRMIENLDADFNQLVEQLEEAGFVEKEPEPEPVRKVANRKNVNNDRRKKDNSFVNHREDRLEDEEDLDAVLDVVKKGRNSRLQQAK